MHPNERTVTGTRSPVPGPEADESRKLEDEVVATLEKRRKGHPKTRTERDAFLIVENQRRSLAARLQGSDRPRPDRYRDLLLVTYLIQLEYGYVAARVNRSQKLPSLTASPTTLGKDTPAKWAQPWGVGAMFELRAAFVEFSKRRDRVARRLSPEARIEATAEAKERMAAIFDAGGLE